MSQELATPTAETLALDADGGGIQPGMTRMFTEAELQAIVKDRLARQRRQFGDYDALKTASEELATLKLAQMSELEGQRTRGVAQSGTRRGQPVGE